jgi:dihydrolipoamide dehydrogenase
MTTKITVMGAGPGGYVAAVRAAQLGAEVTVIEADNVGGTCLNWGCIPSKVMITTAELYEKIHQSRQYGIEIEGSVRLDMQQLMARKNAVIQSQTKGIHDLFKHHKIQYINGTGFIKEPGLVTVTQPQAEEIEVPWDKLILATGTKPFSIPSMPFDGQRILSSDHALSLAEVPASIIIVGGGVIGCEFAFMLSALGSNVTVVEALSRLLPLPSVDEACSNILQREMKKRKIKFMVNRSVDAFEDDGHKLRVTIGPSPFLENPSEKDKEPLTAEAAKMLICIGRKPCTDALGLENVGIEPNEKGWIATDERMQTAAANVYAIGDILGPEKIMLAHVASTEGQVAAENAAGGSRTMNYQVVPGAIFTTPEVANVGLSESQAKEQGYSVRADSVLFRTLGKAQVIGEIAGEAKIVSEAGSGKILGVHIIGPHATDLIAEGALALQIGGSVKDLAETIHAHPTLAEIMMEASFKSLDRSLHG